MLSHALKRYLIILLLLSLQGRLIAQPSVIGHPQDASICVDATAQFSITAVNTSIYQWQENDGVGWYNITASITYAQGWDTPTLTISDANTGLNGYQYRCVVYDSQNNSDTSNPATLGVYDPPIITQQPEATQVCKNEIANFSVEALYGTIYQWQENIGEGWVFINDNAFYSGTQTSTLSIFTTTGMNGFNYRCLVTNVSCPEISAPAKLFVDPTPILFGVDGGGSFCENGNGVNIGLSGSETGISYVLYHNDEHTGNVAEGNGEPIDFGTFTTAGIYTVKGINGFTGCEIMMNGQAEVSIDPLPDQQTFSGGGAYCAGSAPPELYLEASENGIVYSLMKNGLATGIEIHGTGFTLSFGQFADPGLYTVLASNPVTGCTIQLENAIQIMMHELPTALAGDNQTIVSGTAANLQGQAYGGSGSYVYQWEPPQLLNQPGSQQTSTIPLYQTSLFSLNVIDLNTQCQSAADSIIIQVTDGPLHAQILASASTVCPGDATTLLALTSGGTGEYIWEWMSQPPGFTANGQEVTLHPESSAQYILTVTDGISTVTDTISIQLSTLPAMQTLVGESSYCMGDEGVPLGLSASQPEAVYSLYRNNQLVTQINGTGQPLSFGIFNEQGMYHAEASLNGSICKLIMNGEIEVQVNEKPLADAGNNQYISAGEQTTLNGSASGGSGSYAYHWTPVEQLLNPGAQNPATMPLSATQLFTLQLTDQQSGCEAEPAQTVVFVNGGTLSMTLAANNYTICKGEEVQLMVLPSGGSGNYTYLWQSDPAGFMSTLYNPTVSPQQTTTYILTLTDGFEVLTDSVVIHVLTGPQSFQLSGGGSYCEGEVGREIFLSSSETEVLYELMHNGSSMQNQVGGTGAALNFGYQTESGTYTVRAIHQDNQCELEMEGSAVIEHITKPIAHAGPDRTIQTGETTELNGGVQGGSGSYTFNWTPGNKVINPNAQQTFTHPLQQTTQFNFEVADNQSGCIGIPDSIMVYVSGGPLSAYAASDVQYACTGSEIHLYGHASGGTAHYQYQWTSIPTGVYANQQNIVVQPLESTQYVLTVYDGQQTSRDTIAINISQPPLPYQLTGGGQLCTTQESVSVGLSGSQAGVPYYLKRNGNLIATITGTGSSISFGLFSQPGSYTAIAGAVDGNCTTSMLGQVQIEVVGRPIAFAGEDKYVESGSQLTLQASVQGGSGDYVYNWTPANKLINPEALQPTTNPLWETTVFKLDITDALYGCQASPDYVAVFVGGDAFNVNAYASTDGECAGAPVQLYALPTGGSGAFSYLWLSDPPGFSSEAYNPTAYPEENTKYIVYVNDGQSIVSDSVYVSVSPAPEVFLFNGSQELCEGSMDPELSLSGSETDIEYRLYKDNAFTGQVEQGTGFPVTFAAVTLAGNYQVKAVNQLSGCSRWMEGEVEINVHPRPLVSAGAHQYLHAGETVQLSATASGGYGSHAFNWSPAYLLDNPFISDPQTIEMEQTTLFYVYVEDAVSGCTSLSDTTIVFVTGGTLSLQLMADQTQVCTGQEVSMQAIPGGGTGQYTINWSDSAGNLLHQGLHFTTSLNESSTFYVELADENQSITDSIHIEVAAHPLGFEVTGGGMYCTGSQGVAVGLSGSENGIAYALYLNDQKLTTVMGMGQPIDFGVFKQTGTYTVWANRPGYSCSLQMEGAALVQSVPEPNAHAGPDQYIPRGSGTQLEGQVSQGSGNYTFRWEPADLLVNPNSQQPFTQQLFYSAQFTLEATDNQSGCTARDNMVVYVEGGALDVQITADQEVICPGTKVRLTALPGGGSGSYTWQWYSKPAGLQSNAAVVTTYPNINTWYYVNISDGENTVMDSIFIRIHELPVAFELTGGGAYCGEDQPPSIGLNGSELGVVYDLMRNGNYTAVRRTGTGSSLDFGPQSAAGNYTIIANSEHGCKTLMQNLVSVFLADPPQKFWLMGGGEYCADEPSGFYLSGSEMHTVYELLRDMEPTGIIRQGNGSPLQFEHPGLTGLYSVEANRGGSCNKMMGGSAGLLILPVPNAQILGETSLCQGDKLELSASGGESYYWLTDPPQSTPDIILSPLENSTFTVIVGNSFGCTAEAEHTVELFPLPVFDWHDNHQSQTLQIHTQSENNIRFISGSETLQDGYSSRFYYGNTALTNNEIIVEVITANQCSSEETIRVNPLQLQINAFSPNNDGINDRFMEGQFMRVFSRWGKALFVGDNGWDGTYNGELVAPGTYYYLIEIKDPEGNIIEARKGSVTLVIE